MQFLIVFLKILCIIMNLPRCVLKNALEAQIRFFGQKPFQDSWKNLLEVWLAIFFDWYIVLGSPPSLKWSCLFHTTQFSWQNRVSFFEIQSHVQEKGKVPWKKHDHFRKSRRTYENKSEKNSSSYLQYIFSRIPKRLPNKNTWLTF